MGLAHLRAELARLDPLFAGARRTATWEGALSKVAIASPTRTSQ